MRITAPNIPYDDKSVENPYSTQSPRFDLDPRNYERRSLVALVPVTPITNKHRPISIVSKPEELSDGNEERDVYKLEPQSRDIPYRFKAQERQFEYRLAA